jgi:AraC family transcriptional regulator
MSAQVEDGTFVGALHARRQFDGLTLAETSYRPALVVPAHAHSSALVTLVLDGGLTEERGHRRAAAEKGALIYHPASEPHGHRFSELGGRCFVLQYGTEWLGRMREFGMAEPAGPIDLRGTRANWLAGQVYREFQAADPAARLGIEGFALAMLGEIARAGERSERGAKPPWLVRAVEMLHARMADELGLAEVATAVGVHPSHLSRTFREHFGMTMSEYLRRQRVELARRLLTGSDRSLSAIAHTTGFSDQAHFSRVFKQVTGSTPGRYRSSASGR